MSWLRKIYKLFRKFWGTHKSKSEITSSEKLWSLSSLCSCSWVLKRTMKKKKKQIASVAKWLWMMKKGVRNNLIKKSVWCVSWLRLWIVVVVLWEFVKNGAKQRRNTDENAMTKHQTKPNRSLRVKCFFSSSSLFDFSTSSYLVFG